MKRPVDAWVSIEELCAAGACVDGARSWRRKKAPTATAMPMQKLQALTSGTDDECHVDRLQSGNGDGDGNGYGYGNGDGDGDGYGDGYGYGNGDGYGDGYGYGYGNGNGDGNG